MLRNGSPLPQSRRFLPLAALWLATVVAAAGGAYAVAHHSARPLLTQVAQATCGVPGSTASLFLPLELLGRGAPDATVRIGPVSWDGLAEPVHLEFHFDRHELRYVGLLDDAVIIPLATDAKGHPPKRLTLGCREDRLALVRFDWDRRRPEYVELMPIGERHRSPQP